MTPTTLTTTKPQPRPRGADLKESDMAKKQCKSKPPTARAKIAKRLFVVELTTGWQVLEIPGHNGDAVSVWASPFNTERAAKLFRDELLDAHVAGDPTAVLNRCDGRAFYEDQARLLELLERREDFSDLRALARDIVENDTDAAIPF